MKFGKIGMILCLMFMYGCTTTAPKYQASFENVQKLKNAGASQVNIGSFVPDSNNKDGVEKLTIRGGSFLSPYNDSYASYLREALRQEFYDAERFSDKSSVVISGVLVRNEIDASGISIGTGTVSARFIVNRDNRTRYDKVRSTSHQWESAFAAANAVPKAHQNYMIMMQKLLGELYGDAEFQNALK